LNKFFYYISICIICFSCTKQSINFGGNTQSLTIDVIKTLGGTKNDAFSSIKKTTDGGYIAVGYAQSSDFDISNKNNDSYDYWVVKFDATNTIEWSKTFGGSDDDRARDILQLSDGSFLVTGFSRSTDLDVSVNSGNYDFWVVKINIDGTLVWEKSFGFSGADQSYIIKQTSDGNFLLGGSLDVTASGGQGNSKTSKRHAGGDYWLLKIDTKGKKLWSRYYGGQFTDTLLDISETENGNYILTGYSDSSDTDISNNLGEYDFWIVKVNNTGDLIWERNFGGSQIDEAFSITKTTDNHFLIAGNTRSADKDVTLNNGSSDIWVIKISSDGTLIWERNFGGTSFDNANKIISAERGGFYVVGSSRSSDIDAASNFGNKDVWILKIDATGNLQWQKNIGGSNLDEASSVIELQNGSLIVSGESWSSDNDILENKGFSDGLIVVLK
jgi:predicted Rdx family selenoprotein